MTAWTANTDTFGMSEYAPFEATCPVVIDGELYAVTADGIVAFDDGTQAPRDYDSVIEWGLEDFGSAELKRPAYAYIAYECYDVALFTLGYIERGIEQSATCELPYRIADDVTAGRFRLGRGARSRHYRARIASFSGYPFVLHDVRLVIDETSRRV